jgi:uncharacterized protein (TIGR01370 family)
MAAFRKWSRRTVIAAASAAIVGRWAPRQAVAMTDPADWRWAVDYGPRSDPALSRHYQLLVLEPDHVRPIAPLRGPDSILLGYVSLGEVEKSRPYFADLFKAGALTKPNPNWPNARMADLRHAAWRLVLLDNIIPAILARGYNGIFIDTTDNAEAMEQADPVGNKGMIDAAAALILAIRVRFPNMRIMLNRGYAVLPQVAGAIDYLLGEAMASRWNFARNAYELLSDDDWNWQADRLRKAQAANPVLRIVTLDYWKSDDTRQVAALYARERKAGFFPYVSTLALDHLVDEPTG